ncbi:hypothetical protein ACCO45_003500 [Purpureocillium lilacinum]|uniref:Uncharacterized protein n=1 Tax=Purpureocillium lilacinum TaxID=33203 RepID=A0ACC4E0Z1_PURLI
MDSYTSSYRDSSARSPNDRTWGRDDREDRGDRGDNFYRARSPGNDRRERRRSRSPGPVDRYEPRSRRDDRDRDDRRRIAEPPANIDRYVPEGNLNAPGGTREAQEERDKEKAKIQAAYDAYKEELQAKMARQFVSEHKKEQWFRERYVAEVKDELRAKLNEMRRGAYSQWEQDLESGTFDNFSLEGLPKSESNGAGGVVEKEEGEATASNEILGVGDLVPASGADIRDENQFQPTLLIKTIAPHVSRHNLEVFCKENLGEEEGGFKWLSLSDPNPSKRYHRIGWVMLHPSSETAIPTDRADFKDEDGDETIKSPQPVSTAEKALDAVNGKTVKDEVRGDFVCHVGVHNPPSNPRKKALWDLFSAPERIEKDLLLVQRLVNKFEEDFGSDFSAVPQG